MDALTNTCYRCVKYGVDPPSGLLDGIGQGLGAAAYEVAGAFYDLVAKPVEGAREGGVSGAAIGMGQGLVGLIARPVKGGGILIDKISTSVSSDQVRRRNRTVAETIKAGERKRFKLNFSFEKPEDREDNKESESQVEPSEEVSDELTEEEQQIEEVSNYCVSSFR